VWVPSLNKVLELFGTSTSSKGRRNWSRLAAKRQCPYLQRLCLKNRKSSPDILIGTCTVSYGKASAPVIICPHRLLQRRQIFTDCLHLLTLHEPGNHLHIIPEIGVPGGSVDYFLASVAKGKIKDFVGIELQTVDTTGTVWPERQRFLDSVGVPVSSSDKECRDSFGMNWKMTAKTILVQLHHKVETFEHINKKLALVLQDHLLAYMQRNFVFDHMNEPTRQGDSMHFHAYALSEERDGNWKMELSKRFSTDANGVGKAMGLQTSAKVELETIISQLEAKMSRRTRFEFGPITDVNPTTEPS
jgi:hypothetical protein